MSKKSRPKSNNDFLGKPRVIDSENQLIDHHVHSGLLTPDSVWHPGSHSGRTAHIEYLIRVRCNINYYGYNCTKFCKPRDDYHGHYTCDRNGNKQCLSGWMGNACNKRGFYIYFKNSFAFLVQEKPIPFNSNCCYFPFLGLEVHPSKELYVSMFYLFFMDFTEKNSRTRKNF